MSAFQMNNYYRPAPVTLDSHGQRYFEEDDSSILDENILEQSALDSGLEMSPPMAASRRESYAVSSTLFSPKTEDWSHVDMHIGSSNTHFADQSNHSFLSASHSGAFGQQSQGWPLGSSSGSCTPMQGYDGLPTEYERTVSLSYRPQGQTPFSNTGNQVALFSPSSTTDGSMPTSPHKDWSPEGMEHPLMTKRMRVGSPGLRSHSPLLRRDGIRKKNARFDIPAERNLLNIDQLIAHSTDEQEIKELKQQKRLLRNRQAALDSRQRKKQHTERLEDEKKQYTQLLNELEEELAESKIALDDWARKEQQYQEYIENLQMEKEEMIRAHTIETGDLRKKVSVLTEHVQKMESTAMSSVPSSSGYAHDYTDIDSLTIDSAWDNISFANDYPLDHDVKPELQVMQPKHGESLTVSEQDKPAAHGLLLMLLLFGALVASTGPTHSIPRMPDDVRAASATLLEDVFKDAGVSQSTGLSLSSFIDAAPVPSRDIWSTSSLHSHDATGLGSITSLGDFADALAQPSEDQKNEQLFSLSAAQYNTVASPDFMHRAPPPSTSQGRRNLADSLAAMRSSSKQSAAEVYTRSLLWDQVPRDVVRNFAKMVSDCNPRHGQLDCVAVD